jgi:transposase InsO family protein
MVFPIEKMCKVFNVSSSGYYNWINAVPSKRMLENIDITKRIISIHKESKGTYGSPMITKRLNKDLIKVSRPRVARLMKASSIESKRKKKFVITTDSSHKYPVVENVLNRNFQVDVLGKSWVSDLTYIGTEQGWLYLTTVIDLADRKVIGWALSETMKASHTSIPAFNMAIKNRPINGELIFHSDRGIQYACTEFKNVLEMNKKVIRSMSRKGNCWDNAVAESFFKTLKSDLIYGSKFKTIKEAKSAVFEYIEIWYNRKRMHSSNEYRTPEEMEEFLLNKKIAA